MKEAPGWRKKKKKEERANSHTKLFPPSYESVPSEAKPGLAEYWADAADEAAGNVTRNRVHL